jgi:hypothetical protein
MRPIKMRHSAYEIIGVFIRMNPRQSVDIFSYVNAYGEASPRSRLVPVVLSLHPILARSRKGVITRLTGEAVRIMGNSSTSFADNYRIIG